MSLPEDRGGKPTGGSYLWNSVGGMLNAGQSVLVLMVLTRTLGLAAAGIYSIAFATGNLFMYLGNFGVRNYQVSDLTEKYDFADYLAQRLLTVAWMMAASGAFVAYSLLAGGYTRGKAAVTAWMCVLKAVDCVEEVYEGRLHQRGRLDLAGKVMSLRLVVSIGGMIIALFAGWDLLGSLILSVVLAAACDVLVLFLWREHLKPAGRVHAGGILAITAACFPVCAANFLQFYLINAPKYAIDRVLSETEQARYSFIAMPVFVIQLMNLFLYQPVLGRMTCEYREGDWRAFSGSIRRILLGLGAISALVLLAGALLGIPVLEILYAAELSDLRGPFLRILVGGIFLALCGFLCAVLTIARRQQGIPLVYLAAAALSLAVTGRAVEAGGIGGGVNAFVAVMAFTAVILALLVARTLAALRAGASMK